MHTCASVRIHAYAIHEHAYIIYPRILIDTATAIQCYCLVFCCGFLQLLNINYVFCRYFQAGGTPEQVINQLSANYTAVAQMANSLAEWLILAGVRVTEVQAMVENHLKDMILRTFDPKKADTIFTEEGEVMNDRQMILLLLFRRRIYNIVFHL